MIICILFTIEAVVPLLLLGMHILPDFPADKPGFYPYIPGNREVPIKLFLN
jgi:hypothetical protein